MGIFKSLFSKLRRNSSPDSNDDEKSDLTAYIVVGAEKSGENFVACSFSNPDQMAELTFLFISGFLTEECLNALRETCRNEYEAQMIIANVFSMLKQKSELEQANQADSVSGKPVVDPCEVFRQGERNEYKG